MRSEWYFILKSVHVHQVFYVWRIKCAQSGTSNWEGLNQVLFMGTGTRSCSTYWSHLSLQLAIDFLESVGHSNLWYLFPVFCAVQYPLLDLCHIHSIFNINSFRMTSSPPLFGLVERQSQWNSRITHYFTLFF